MEIIENLEIKINDQTENVEVTDETIYRFVEQQPEISVYGSPIKERSDFTKPRPKIGRIANLVADATGVHGDLETEDRGVAESLRKIIRATKVKPIIALNFRAEVVNDQTIDITGIQEGIIMYPPLPG